MASEGLLVVVVDIDAGGRNDKEKFIAHVLYDSWHFVGIADSSRLWSKRSRR